MNNINIIVMLKEGGSEPFKIPASMISELAVSIKNKGSEFLHTAKRSVEVVGFMVVGDQVGERIIVLGSKGDTESTESP